MTNIAIFASGSGTNAENITKHFEGNEGVNITLVVSNKSDAFVHKRAQNMGIESVTFSKNDFTSGDVVLKYLVDHKIDFIVLAGFLLKIPESLIESYPNRIVNIHPALLPKHGGKGMYGDNVHRAVIEAGDTESGITIHYVNKNYDEGNTIFQAKCEVTSDDTYEDVAKKVHILEYTHFPIVIEQLLDKQ